MSRAAPDADLERDDEDDAEAIPKSVVIDDSFDWQDDRPPERPWNETAIYEVHTKGFTKLMPGVREELRGTYAGLASEPALAYLTSLGVTAVELLPIHHIADEMHLVAKGLTNYWGYSSIGYLAPHALYAATGRRGEQVKEFKGMVKALHGAGIEVILDVVYNHTAEGNHLGPMLSFKGIDNLSYYRTVPGDPRHYMDYTGTGNSLNPVHPSVLRLIMDSLRYFVIECHVDGFRFDLASALAREFHEVDRLSAFFDIIHQDPILSQVKLIAEPWDVGEGGYQVGNFPVLWTEWNGIYRDTMRDFWRGQAPVSEFASRFTGSSDLYQHDGRRPFASINFITAHDGFTLRDLVSYNEKHNEANLENRTRTVTTTTAAGTTASRARPTIRRSTRCASGRCATSSRRSSSRRACRCCSAATRSRGRSAATTTPTARTTRSRGSTGSSTAAPSASSRSRRRLIELRTTHPVFHRADFLTGEERLGSGAPDVWWFRPDGRKMTQRNWRDDDALTLGVFLNGSEIPTQTQQGAPVIDDTFLILFNAWEEPIVVHAPGRLVRPSLDARALDRRAGARAGRRGLPGPRRRAGRRALARRAAASRRSRSGRRLDGRVLGLSEHAQADVDDLRVELRAGRLLEPPERLLGRQRARGRAGRSSSRGTRRRRR